MEPTRYKVDITTSQGITVSLFYKKKEYAIKSADGISLMVSGKKDRRSINDDDGRVLHIRFSDIVAILVMPIYEVSFATDMRKCPRPVL